MKSILYKSESRGRANHGWLDTHFTFSFANYYNPERVHFGALRVLNDDIIDGGQGFGKHPHDNMEIITIPLEGELKHEDSMGHASIIKPGEVQVMTAGTGIFHSEFNHLPDTQLKLFQIWIFPYKNNLTPRYDQRYFDPAKRLNTWQVLVAPDDANALMIHQHAWFSRITLQQGMSVGYSIHNPNNGLFVFNISGTFGVADNVLNHRDAIGLWDVATLELTAEAEADILVIEVPKTN